MDDSGKNPCDLCKRHDCDADCALYRYASKFECTEYNCFINYEGSCTLGIYENCGAWKG